MKIRDAKPGDVLRDWDGDVWLVQWKGQVIVAFILTKSDGQMADEPVQYERHDAERFGPFVRLAPEREGE